jgi:hypothetical protein
VNVQESVKYNCACGLEEEPRTEWTTLDVQDGHPCLSATCISTGNTNRVFLKDDDLRAMLFTMARRSEKFTAWLELNQKEVRR